MLRMTESAYAEHQKRVGKGWAKGQEFVPRTSCANCGKAFYSPPSGKKRGQGIYCSYKCKGLSTRRQILTRICRKCRNRFEVPASELSERYCSVCKAARPAAQIKTPNTCAQCGAQNATQNKFCGAECHAKFCRTLPQCRPRGGLKKNSVCQKCGADFYASPYQRQIGGGKYCSMGCRSLPKHGSAKGGIRADLGIYVRSSWEANYARYLNWLLHKEQIAAWEYEPDTFEFPVKRGCKFYTPDFKITELDNSTHYVEVKGYVDQKSRTRATRMALHHPQVIVKMVGLDEMRALKRSLGKLIPNWEQGRNDKLN